MQCSNNCKQIGLALLNYESAIRRFPPGMRFVNSGTPIDAVGTAWVSLLPYLEQSNAANAISSAIPWCLQNAASVQIIEAVYLCPSDAMESLHSYPFIGALGLPCGDKFATCSYGMNLGVNDAISFSPGFRPRPVTAFSGVFAFHSATKIADISDGTSNTFSIGEAASGFDMCQGIGCLVPSASNPAGEKKSTHGWLVGNANPSTLFAGGFRYSGGFASTVERINKSPVTDSFYDVAKINNNTPSWQGGPHRAPNFRSFHTGGANFSFCDGSVQYLSQSIDLKTFQALSTIQGGEVGELINGRFWLLSELGRGGMAVVHLAEDVATGQRFALKMMSTRLTGSAKQRFTREFSTIASLKNPCLIEVFEYGESAAVPFFVMELFSGKPATDMLGSPLSAILEAIYKLCEAVDFAHGKRIVHRDIKPANILVQPKADGSGLDIRLSDFGLAKFANSSSSLSGDVNFLGTIAYCAPEQIMREELDHRADIYSLGMVVFELLTGRHAFHEFRKNAQALISKQLTSVPTSVRKYNKNISVELERAILKMLAKEQDNRPNSTLELRQAIAYALGWSESHVSNSNSLSSGSQIAHFIARENELKILESYLADKLRGQPAK